jgi:hypothetical protein
VARRHAAAYWLSVVTVHWQLDSDSEPEPETQAAMPPPVGGGGRGRRACGGRRLPAATAKSDSDSAREKAGGAG